MPENTLRSTVHPTRHPRVLGLAAVTAALTTVLAGALPASASSSASASADPSGLTVRIDQLPHGGAGSGDLFLTPSGPDGNSVEILSPDGRTVVWKHALPAGESAADFRTQTYRGQQVLTWWQGTGLGGLATGEDVIYDSHYRQIAVVKAGNGYSADGHEFLLTPRGTALILSYTTATADLTAIGGPADQTVIDGLVQEVDVRSGRVLFQWNSADHVPYAQSEQPLPASATTPWDWFHVNAVKLDTDGNLLVDARNTWTTYKLAAGPGRILWQLGGKASTFKEVAAPGQTLNAADRIFAWQHDPEPLGNGLYSVFDNESAGIANTGQDATTELPYSRAVTFRLDLRTRTAILIASDDQPEGLSASSQGDAQPLPGGGRLVGWGAQPYIAQFDASGRLVFDAELPAGTISYRAYRLPWHPQG